MKSGDSGGESFETKNLQISAHFPLGVTTYIWLIIIAPISGKEMLRLFLDAGWTLVRITGSHHVMRKGKQTEVIPIHGNEDLGKGLERKPLKRMTEEE